MLKEKIWRKENGLLAVMDKNGEKEVFIKQSFPLSHPGEFLSLRDSEDNEILMVESLNSDVSPDVKALLLEELLKSQFVLNIKEIVNIQEDVELRRFHVLTEQGSRHFQTKLEDWPEILSGETILIEDLCGDLFHIDNWKKLDKESQKKLTPYVS